MPVNCCTIALKFDASVLRSVVGALLEALDRFLLTLPVAPFTDKYADDVEPTQGVAKALVVTDVASELTVDDKQPFT